MQTRAEHLQWAKDRALTYLEPPQIASGRPHTPEVSPKQLSDACASILSDLTKHPEIDPSAARMVFGIEALTGGLNTVEKVKHFINGIN